VASLLQGASNHAQAIQTLSGIVNQNATVLAYDYVFRFSALLFLLAVPTVFLLRRPAPAGGVAEVPAE
jgi:hypothetical protein